MTGRDIVCIAPTEWNGAWQRYHEIARRFARAGNRVLVLENLFRPALATPTSARGALALANNAWATLRRVGVSAREVEPDLAVLSPPVRPGARGDAIGRAVVRWTLGRTLRALRFERPILWTAYPSPMLDLIAEEVRPALVVYDCASAFAADPSVASAVVAAEAALLQRADLVFTDSRTLWERHSARHHACHWVPTGVDYARFSATVGTRASQGQGLVVGYVGTLHAWLDVALCAAVAQANPDWSFVYVGPRRSRVDVSTLERLPNVHLRAAVAHDDLPAIVAGFDVAWIPYRVAEFTRYVFPTKLLEYMAAARPVVSTDLPEVRAFAPPVRLAADPSALAAQIRAAALAGADHDAQRIARGFDWQRQFDRIEEHLDVALAAARRA